MLYKLVLVAFGTVVYYTTVLNPIKTNLYNKLVLNGRSNDFLPI